MYRSPFRYGDRVQTPAGPGTVVHVDAEMDWRRGGVSFGPGPVEVQLDGKPYPFDQYRSRVSFGDPFDPADLVKRAPVDGDLGAWMESHRGGFKPWKPARPSKLGRLGDARREKLEREWAEAVAAYAVA
jgi:hypothetical protein